jgi:hypothetical protein
MSTFPRVSCYRKYHVTVTSTTLEFGYVHGWTMKCINRSQIELVELVVEPPISGLWQWGGWGIRGKRSSSGLVWRETGYIYKDGPGLRIKVMGDDGSIAFYTFNTNEPTRVKELLSVPVKSMCIKPDE